MDAHYRFLNVAEVIATAAAFFGGIAAILSLFWM